MTTEFAMKWPNLQVEPPATRRVAVAGYARGTLVAGACLHR